ncbi:MAG: VWA domain-containing protein [Candidatus Poribacteria bacterium]|nr:VWA domain-containing protein [Candidatus Poribacteria bacterium]
MRKRSHRALLISLIIHLCFSITLTIVLYRHDQEAFEDVVSVEFINEKELPKPRRKLLKPPPAQRLIVPRQVRSSIVHRPQTVKLEAAANPIDETLRVSERSLLHSATTDQLNPQDQLPDVTTAAARLNSRETQIAESVSTRFQTGDGDGVKSHRQRVKGDGSGRLHALKSTGASDIGIVDDRPDKRGTGQGSESIVADNPYADALRRLADHIIATRTKDKVDVVFVLDTSASMQDNIQQVAEHLFSMTDAYDEINLEYYLGMARFSVEQAGQIVKIRSLLPDVGMLSHQMKKVRISGDEHALDALVDTFNYIEFHSDAEKHLVLVTDEPATTRLKTGDAVLEMREKVISNCKSQEIHVNVLGHTERFQKRLATETGGLWQEIPGGQADLNLAQSRGSPAPHIRAEPVLKVFRKITTDIRRTSGTFRFSIGLELQSDLDDKGNLISKGVLKAFKNNGHPLSQQATHSIQEEGSRWLIRDYPQTYMIRKEMSALHVYVSAFPGPAESLPLQNHAEFSAPSDPLALQVDATGRAIPVSFSRRSSPESNRVMADIVIMLDYSRSMGGKSQVLGLGISELIGKLNLLPIHYQIGLIRFAEAKDAIKAIDGTVVTAMPIGESRIQSLMQFPFGGDEHLIDAIVEGLPKIRFRPNASRFLLVLTDEPSTGSHPPEHAIEICQSLGVRAYVIGVPGKGDFQWQLAQQTSGLFFRMPNHLSKTYPNQ